MIITSTIEFKPGSQFGSVHNPITAIGLTNKEIPEEMLMETVVPLESINASEWNKYINLSQINKRKLIFQTYLEDKKLSIETLEFLDKSGIVCQIWIDRPLQDQQKETLSCATKYANVEVVYCPRLLFHPSEFDFSNINIPSITIHIRQQENEFDSWPTEVEFWHYLLWVKSHWPVKKIKTQIFKEQLAELDQEELVFYLAPHPKSFSRVLKKRSPSKFILHYIILEFCKTLGPTLWEFLRWPLLKPYWVLRYQFRKRILKNAD